MTAKTSKSAAAVAKADAVAAEKLGEHRGSPAVRALSRLGKLGDQPEMRTLSAGVIALGLLLRNKRMAAAGIRMLVAHELATAAKDFIKVRVSRTRPQSASRRSQAMPKLGHDTAKRRSSFPSGHSAGSIAAAQAFAREFPEHRALVLTAAGLVGVAQVPKQAHYPTDVAAGAVIGLACEALIGKLWPADNSGDEQPRFE